MRREKEKGGEERRRGQMEGEWQEGKGKGGGKGKKGILSSCDFCLGETLGDDDIAVVIMTQNVSQSEETTAHRGNGSAYRASCLSVCLSVCDAANTHVRMSVVTQTG